MTMVVELRIASANFHFGGVDSDTGSIERWEKSVSALQVMQPHIVLCQEMSGGRPARLLEHMWATANALGMIPLLGPPTPLSITGNHPVILVASRGGLAILDAGPAPYPPELGSQPAWCEALVQVPGWAYPLRVYSVHLPARSSVEQRSQVDRLASQVAELGELAVVGGDWNCYGRADAISSDDLKWAPRHLRPPRMRYTPDLGTVAPNYDVHDVMASVGLEDAAAILTPGQRDPADLTPTRSYGGGRVDRIYVTWELADAVARYLQRDTGGSDRQATMLALDGLKAARAIPSGLAQLRAPGRGTRLGRRGRQAGG
jgi:endonuclease/exonuclease/phosphatase family metal-dependent hydrolase